MILLKSYYQVEVLQMIAVLGLPEIETDQLESAESKCLLAIDNLADKVPILYMLLTKNQFLVVR